MSKNVFIFALALYSTSALSVDIFTADRLFTDQHYQQAKQAYLEAAEVGNPHAYYQLANIYYKGLGGEEDLINALLYYNLAAEQNFHNAQAIIDEIFNSLEQEQRKSVSSALEEHLLSHGKQQVINKYFPIIDSPKLTMRVSFDGELALQTKYTSQDIELDDLNLNLGNDQNFDDNGDIEDGDSIALLISTPKTPFLIIDHDIYSDGTIRYSTEIQKYGLTKNLLNEFTLFALAKPEFEGVPVDFASRSYLGAATYSKFTMVRENEKLYGNVLKQIRRFKSGDSINDRFNLAMLMLNFPWIEQAENEAEERLLALSKQGHSPAMYEYGFKLYREQRDIEQAVHWISESSKYGLVRAEYRLAKILESSPWVKNDERKALFWYQSAMKKGDISSAIRATDILLTAKDESLRDMALAIQYLSELETSQSNNPEYFYLSALTYRTGERRNIKMAVDNLSKAIFKGQFINWDTSQWQELLREITTGTIFVTDE